MNTVPVLQCVERPGRSSLRRVWVLAAMGSIAVLSACGPSSKAANPSTTATSAGTSGGAGAAALQPFRDCVTQHGVTLPTPRARPSTSAPAADAGATTPDSGRRGGGGGGGSGGLNSVFSDPANQGAIDACKDTLPAGFLAQQQARQNARAAFVSCMSDHGVTSTSGVASTTLDTSSPAYQACSPLLPARNPGGPTTTTTPTTTGP